MDYIEYINNQFNKIDNKYKKVVLSGLSGIGKTQLAKSYCEKNNYEAIIWLESTIENKIINSSIVNVLKEMEVNNNNISSNSSLVDLIKQLFQHLKNKYDKFLIVFDSLNKAHPIKIINDIDNIVNKEIHILITSNKNDWVPLVKKDNIIKVEAFNKEESIILLEKLGANQQTALKFHEIL